MVGFTTEQFIEKCSIMHNYKYSYNNTVYINKRTKCIITCRVHGDIEVYAGNHMYGSGCKICKHQDISNTKTSGRENTFLEKSKILHGNKYDYSKVKYVNKKTPVIIICPVHGEFLQQPFVHIAGNSCRKCNHPGCFGSIAKYKPDTPTRMYFIKCSLGDEVFYKIGLTTNTRLNDRLVAFKKYYEVEIIEVISGIAIDLYKEEQIIMKFLEENKLKYEPKYKFKGHTECFKW